MMRNYEKIVIKKNNAQFTSIIHSVVMSWDIYMNY